MITPSDNDFIETKAILSGSITPENDIVILKRWINKKFGIKALHIVQDHLNTLNKPRLNVIVEKYSDVDFFRDERYNYDKKKQRLISEKFESIKDEINSVKTILLKLIGQKRDKYFVCFSAYIPVAKCDIINSIPKQKITEFIDGNLTPEIWKIHDTSIVFVHKESDIEPYKSSSNFQKLNKDFINMVKPFDKNKYFDENKPHFSVDLKENFDNNYESNWFYYYK